ncbi:MAG: phosphoadenosine phosphosulfate reductase, partial [Paracoccaceae bacterium]
MSGHWQAQLEELGAREGFYANLGPDHATLFVKRNNTLIVTFETARSIVERQVGQMPFGLTVSEMRNCSHLCLIAKTKSWYRDPNIFAFFDSLVDESFFEDFDNVVFFGAGMAGYA